MYRAFRDDVGARSALDAFHRASFAFKLNESRTSRAPRPSPFTPKTRAYRVDELRVRYAKLDRAYAVVRSLKSVRVRFTQRRTRMCRRSSAVWPCRVLEIRLRGVAGERKKK